jgi:small subunit ribosomal protein S2
VLDGISAEMMASGRDIGAAEELPPAAMPRTEAPAEQPAAD